ncbi:MAG: hypothetical protein MZV70_13620 [Desulfobacterales bacterium]|nr:hypothetical protein [Desulfobacterales bacterium]
MITVVDQVLSLNRTIFLEKVEGDHRVREVRPCAAPSRTSARGGGTMNVHLTAQPSRKADRSDRQQLLLFEGPARTGRPVSRPPLFRRPDDRFLGLQRRSRESPVDPLFRRLGP